MDLDGSEEQLCMFTVLNPLLALGLLFLECGSPWHHELKCLFFCPPLQKGKKRGRKPKGSGEAASEGASAEKVILSGAEELKF
jgi:hypothetical protein